MLAPKLPQSDRSCLLVVFVRHFFLLLKVSSRDETVNHLKTATGPCSLVLVEGDRRRADDQTST